MGLKVDETRLHAQSAASDGYAGEVVAAAKNMQLPSTPSGPTKEKTPTRKSVSVMAGAEMRTRCLLKVPSAIVLRCGNSPRFKEFVK